MNRMPVNDLEFFVELERAVWEALVAGDPEADRPALADHFLGIYPTGFAAADDHAAQLANGPTVASYRIDETRTLEITNGHVMLSYRATYRRPGHNIDEQMYVSSLWSNTGGGWRNVLSQDTPLGGSVV